MKRINSFFYVAEEEKENNLHENNKIKINLIYQIFFFIYFFNSQFSLLRFFIFSNKLEIEII